MLTLDKLKRCPKCKSADIIPFGPHSLFSYECVSCGTKITEQDVQPKPTAPPTNPESAQCICSAADGVAIYGRSKSMDKRLEARGKPKGRFIQAARAVMPKFNPLRKDGSYHYSGDGSRQFWLRVNRLRSYDHDTLYAMGCVLQNLEEHVLRLLRNAEERHAK